MKTPMQQHSLLFQFACRLLKYFLLAVFGFTLVCLLSSAFGAMHLASALMNYLGDWFLRLAVLVLSCLAAATIYESLRR